MPTPPPPTTPPRGTTLFDATGPRDVAALVWWALIVAGVLAVMDAKWSREWILLGLMMLVLPPPLAYLAGFRPWVWMLGFTLGMLLVVAVVVGGWLIGRFAL